MFDFTKYRPRANGGTLVSRESIRQLHELLRIDIVTNGWIDPVNPGRPGDLLLHLREMEETQRVLEEVIREVDARAVAEAA